jgi:hypothetical protein
MVDVFAVTFPVFNVKNISRRLKKSECCRFSWIHTIQLQDSSQNYERKGNTHKDEYVLCITERNMKQ